MLKDPNFWAAVSAVASAASALFALLVVMQTARSQARETANRRAYIRVVIDVMEITAAGAARIPLKVSNIGQHPAANIEAKIVMVGTEGGNELALNREFLISNELVQGGMLDMSIPIGNPAADTPRQLILFVVRYDDKVLSRTFSQRYYFEWFGMVDGRPSEALTHCQMEIELADARMGKYLQEFEPLKIGKSRLVLLKEALRLRHS